jgi:hypothetical protein
MSLTEEEVIRITEAYRDASVEIMQAAQTASARHAQSDVVDLLQELIEAKVKAENEPVLPSTWSESVKPKPKLTAAEKKRMEEKRIDRETQGGRFLPKPKDPEPRWKNQQAFDCDVRLYAPAPVSPYACPTCTPFKRGEDCTGECTMNPRFFSARRMTWAEFREFERRRGE